MLLARHRTFAVLFVLTITLAVGANVVVFSIVNALWLRPQPIDDPDRVVVILRRTQALDPSRWSDLGLERLRESGLFERVSGEVVTRDLFAQLQPRIVIEQVGRPVETVGVTANYFAALGVRISGRDFTQSDDWAGANPVAIVSDDLWRRSLGGRAGLLGVTLNAAPEPITIVGIAPPGFRGAFRGQHVDIWIPHRLIPRLNGLDAGVNLPMTAICRLQRGVSIEDAQGRLGGGPRRYDRETEVVPLGRMFGAPDLSTVVIREGTFMSLVVATALLVLLGGCGTLMALVLVHYEQRRRELAIRSALGATRARLARQLVLELAVVLVAGVVSANMAARWALAVMPRVHLPSSVAFDRLDYGLDWRVVVVGIVACALSIAAAACLPMFRVVRGAIATDLSSSHVTAPRQSLRIRRAVLCVHGALTTVLLVGAALFVRTVDYGFAILPGFDIDHALFLTVHMKGRTDSDFEARAVSDLSATYSLIQRLYQIPSVETVAIGPAPLGGRQQQALSSPQVVATDSDRIELPVAWIQAGAGYLDAIGAPLLLGRAGERREAVITTTLAEELWPGESPIGRSLRYGPFNGTVVGVVDLAYGTVRSARPAVIISFEMDKLLPGVLHDRNEISFAIRTLSPERSRHAIEDVVNDVFPDATLVRLQSGRDIVAEDLGREQMAAWFFSGFGLIALALGIGGVFGLVAYLVHANRREYAVMIAIGARPADVMAKTFWTGVSPIMLGVCCGLIVTTLLARTLEAFLLGLRGVDPLVYVTVPVLFVGCGAAAALAAALRIRHIAPMDALRSE